MNKTIHHDVAQNSNEWFELRLGRITASNMDDIADCYTQKGKLKESSNAYINKLVFERMTKQVISEQGFAAAAMQWGRDNERDAINAVAEHLKENIDTCGVYESPYGFLASPDGVIHDDEFNTIPVEVKCPFNPNNHIDNVLTGSLFERYKWQVHAQIVALKAPYGYFASFDPRLDGAAQLHVMRVNACNDMGETIITQVGKANELIDSRVAILTRN